MPALPQIEPEESARRNSAEKKYYRLSLKADSKKALLGDSIPANKQSLNSNDSDVNSVGEKTATFESNFDNRWSPCSRYFQEVVNAHMLAAPTPSPSLSKVAHHKKQHKSAQTSQTLPRWLDAVGLWIPAKQKSNSYESFSKNVSLQERGRDMFLDRFPNLPRCNHARTLSALLRQQRRLQAEDDTRKEERCMRIINSLTKLRGFWDKWKYKSESIGTEHLNRLDAFRKTRETYTDRSEFVMKKREERKLREKKLREREARRLSAQLEKQRRRLPKIIFTHYDEEMATNRETSAAEKQNQEAAIDAISTTSDDNIDEKKHNEVPGTNVPKDETETPRDIGCACELKRDSKDSSLERLSVPIGATALCIKQECIHSQIRGDLKVTESSGNADERAFVCENCVIADSTKSWQQTSQRTNSNSTGNVAVCHICTQGTEQTNTSVENLAITDRAKSLSPLREVTATVRVLKSSSRHEAGQAASDKNENVRNTGIVDSQKGQRSFGDEESGLRMAGKVEEVGLDSYLLSAPSLSSLSHHRKDLLGNIGAADETVCLMSTNAPVPLGVAAGFVPHSAMTASSSQDRYRRANQARLHNTPQGKNLGAWQPKTNNNKQFLQVDLGSVTTVLQVATQGCPSTDNASKRDKCWVKSYTLAFSKDGKKWKEYREGEKVKEFKGNYNNETVVVNSLGFPVEAQFVRFLPRSWKNSIAMRVEVFGEFAEVESQATVSLSGDQELLDEEPSLMEQAQEEELNNELYLAEALTPVDSEEPWQEIITDSITETAPVLQCTAARVTRSSCPPLVGVAVQGTKSSTAKRRTRKPKSEKVEKKKKKQKASTVMLPSIVPVDDIPEEVETERSSPDEEQEGVSEEDPLFEVPPLPELPERKESVTQSRRARTVNMFGAVPSPTIEDPKPRRRRVPTDNRIRMEMLQQQLAEDRRQKLRSAMNQLKQRDFQARTPSPDLSSSSPFVDDFLTKNCIFGDGQRKYYQRIFKSFDEDQDGYLFPEEVLEALEFVNSNLLSDSHLNYIYRVLDLCDCSLESGADIKLFSVVAALSQRVAALDDFANILLVQLDFKELDYKLQRAKTLFTCYVDEVTKTIPLEYLMLDLMAGGLGSENREQIMKTLGRTSSLDFLDFLTYIPLFIYIHDHVLSDPLGSVT